MGGIGKVYPAHFSSWGKRCFSGTWFTVASFWFRSAALRRITLFRRVSWRDIWRFFRPTRLISAMKTRPRWRRKIMLTIHCSSWAGTNKKKSRGLLQTRTEIIALRCRRAIMFWTCKGGRASICAGSRNHSRLCRIKLSASIWILLPWTSGELDRHNRFSLIDTSVAVNSARFARVRQSIARSLTPRRSELGLRSQLLDPLTLVC